MDQLLADGVWNAVVIWRELQAKGYRGGISILRDYIQSKRALRPSRATVRFETEPGRQLQTDWAIQRTQLAGREVDVPFLVSTLSYSRRFHFWCTDAEDAEHTYEGLVRAFEWFGGAPAASLTPPAPAPQDWGRVRPSGRASFVHQPPWATGPRTGVMSTTLPRHRRSDKCWASFTGRRVSWSKTPSTCSD